MCFKILSVVASFSKQLRSVGMNNKEKINPQEYTNMPTCDLPIHAMSTKSHKSEITL